MKILKNTSPTSVDIMDPKLGYYVPLMSQAIVIAPHPIESKNAKLDPVESLDEVIESIHQCRPHVIDPEEVMEEVAAVLQDRWGASESYTRFNGRDWKVYVDFGVKFNEQKKFLMFLNEKKMEMRFLKFLESGGQIIINPLEELCLLAAFND